MPRPPPPELVRGAHFEPPLELVDQVAFSVRGDADAFVAALAFAAYARTYPMQDNYRAA